MADSFTPNLGLTLMENGTHNNTWNDEYISNDERIDAKFGDVTTINSTGGTTVLTGDQERVNVIKATGALVSNKIIELSGIGGAWIIQNDTTGSFSLTVKVTGLTGVTVDQGSKVVVYFNGTDIATLTELTAASLGVGTSDSPQFAAVNVGHASDTTLARIAAGRAAIEGVEIARLGAGLACRIKTGSYTGDGATSKAITGVGFTPKYVKIWQRVTTLASVQHFETTAEIMDDNASGGSIQHYADSVGAGSPVFAPNTIIAPGSDGFTVDDAGANDHPNASGVIYNYLCLG